MCFLSFLPYETAHLSDASGFVNGDDLPFFGCTSASAAMASAGSVAFFDKNTHDRVAVESGVPFTGVDSGMGGYIAAVAEECTGSDTVCTYHGLAVSAAAARTSALLFPASLTARSTKRPTTMLFGTFMKNGYTGAITGAAEEEEGGADDDDATDAAGTDVAAALTALPPEEERRKQINGTTMSEASSVGLPNAVRGVFVGRVRSAASDTAGCEEDVGLLTPGREGEGEW